MTTARRNFWLAIAALAVFTVWYSLRMDAAQVQAQGHREFLSLLPAFATLTDLFCHEERHPRVVHGRRVRWAGNRAVQHHPALPHSVDRHRALRRDPARVPVGTRRAARHLESKWRCLALCQLGIGKLRALATLGDAVRLGHGHHLSPGRHDQYGSDRHHGAPGVRPRRRGARGTRLYRRLDGLAGRHCHSVQCLAGVHRRTDRDSIDERVYRR